ncbi:putative Prenyltransferase and squalene oxidase repeat [Trypanosoma vivax]|uniref:Protein farnesyltransferase subunit beta n=1 Tax=Trypanosoma vivax (strain Y486) TaxID=1055687 RepID=G0TXI2_TRYVY|nr:putative Prenyltransferase and squalene oxidase repeat [Trypanosoma vivax]CCC48672.1 putative protein farnesyltransferase [Trypanosoma vivax Y486]
MPSSDVRTSPATPTTIAQREVELLLLRFLQYHQPDVYALWATHPVADMLADDSKSSSGCDEHYSTAEGTQVRLYRDKHVKYLQKRLVSLPASLESLYSAQPWLVYWTLQAADVLGVLKELFAVVPPEAMAEFLFDCLKVSPTDVTPGSSGTSDVSLAVKTVASESLNDSTDARQQSSSAYPNEKIKEDDEALAIGFGGGRLAHIPHIAATYAAVSALCMLGRTEYLQSLPRAAIKRWLLSLRCEDGSFRMHVGGEVDIRASYCVSVVVTLLQIDGVLDEKAARFVASCQTHEGGFACGDHASEAHGAYTYCGIAALILMKRPQFCNYAMLRRFLAARQLRFEGGFNGRTNKLVDSCYAHWVGGAHVLLRVAEAYTQLLGLGDRRHCLTSSEMMLLNHAQLISVTRLRPSGEEILEREEEKHKESLRRVELYINASPTPAASSGPDPFTGSPPCFWDEEVGDFYFNQRRLQLYVLACCQEKVKGGLMDKPNYPNDAYHTCYALSGMSAAQNLHYMPYDAHCGSFDQSSDDNVYAIGLRCGLIPGTDEDHGVVLATTKKDDALAQLQPTNPIFNIHHRHVTNALRAWGLMDCLP